MSKEHSTMTKLIRIPGQPIVSEVDFDKPGRHLGYLRLPHSVHRSAYGWLPIPVASFKRGEGPVVVVQAGNHGDEYEGQVIVSRLIRELDLDQVNGQIILLPMANFPAAQAGTRTSPLDDGNLNRLFPGNSGGTPTQIIAHFLESVIYARSQLLLDLHSGGSSLQYDGMNLIVAKPRDDEERRSLLPLLQAFGAKYTYFREVPSAVTSIGAARRQGSVSFVAELGGAGTVSPDVLRQAWDGVWNVLAAIGVIRSEGREADAGRPLQIMHIDFDSPDFHLYADCAGLLEPMVDIGEEVTRGQAAARIHFPAELERSPRTLYFPIDAVVVCKRIPAQVIHGDCIFQLAQRVTGNV